ncbi:MAG: hypothetical protein DI535_19655 [Citrobacter freundii]|nr:MAG: hypothetical protein DI535_19655 [Citrobacter freundii]
MEGEQRYTDKDLIHLVAKGSEDAFTRLFRLYQERVFQTAIVYLKSSAGAEEVVQEVFIRIWQKRESLIEIQHFEAWLRTLTRNHIIDHLRKLARESALMKGLPGHAELQENTADYKARESQYKQLLQEAMKELSPRQQEIYRLLKDEQLTYEQAGERLGLSALTVKTHISRAFQSIRSFLEKHGEVYVLLLLLKNKF